MANWRYLILILALSVICFTTNLGDVHLFDWDEINFAECSREMLVTGDYGQVTIDYKPFHEKPPLFFWLQSTSMRFFGVNEMAARLPNAICGIITLVIIFLIGQRHYGAKFGFAWAIMYFGSILPHFYFKSGIIDPFFNLFIFISLYCLILYISLKRNYLILILAGIALGLAMLTKGPAALAIIGLTLCGYWAYRGFRLFVNPLALLAYLAIGLSMLTLGYGLAFGKMNSELITAFVEYQVRLLRTEDAGHGGFFGYHFVVLLFGCFPASFFALPALFRNFLKAKDENDFRALLVLLFWAILLIFSFAQTKIAHYSSLAYFPITFLAATYITSERAKGKIIDRLARIYGLILSCLLMLLPFIGLNLQRIIPLINDKFVAANLQSNVQWSPSDAFSGIAMLVAVVLSWLIGKRLSVYWGRLTFVLVFGLSVNFTLRLVIPKVEPYSQGASIEFFEALRGKDVYILPLGYKSYAHYFYGRATKQENPSYYDPNYAYWLLEGNIDKDAYFISKNTNAFNVMREWKKLKLIGEKNGFVFYFRRH